MSFNFNKIGKSIATINGGKYSNKKLFVSDNCYNGDDEYVKEFTQFNIPDEGKFQQIPDKKKEREILYIVGASGSGKSTYATAYIKEVQKIHKDYPLYVFSTLTDDFNDLDPKRIRITRDLIDNPITIEELRNSICVFDDIDVLPDKKVRESLLGTLNQILEVGRHYNVFLIMTNHLATNGKDTKRILNECHSITIFPHSGSGRNTAYLLENYAGLDKKDILKIRKLKSRWATIFKHYPQCVMSEKNAYMLHSDC
jgi:predicted AAA+ superfamily ATPase